MERKKQYIKCLRFRDETSVAVCLISFFPPKKNTTYYKATTGVNYESRELLTRLRLIRHSGFKEKESNNGGEKRARNMARDNLAG